MSSSLFTAASAKHAFERRVDEIKSPKSTFAERDDCIKWESLLDINAEKPISIFFSDWQTLSQLASLVLHSSDTANDGVISDINALILDYLTMEGYPNAAAKFSKEANLQPQQDIESIRTRQEIQNCIHSGNIQSAIQMLNELDPQILDGDKALHFSLLRLQLVELIRNCNATGGDISPALKFATEQLGPRAPTNSGFLEELEKTMALLLFPPEALEPQLAALLNPELRRDAADSVNRAILKHQSRGREAAIRQLVKMRAWAESAARDRGISLPDRLDVGLTDDEDRRYANPDNGHEPMVTV